MDKAANNAIFAVWLNGEVKQILEAEGSSTPWSLVDKTKLPPQCFLWIEDRTKKSTWHLPYREGAGGIDPNTGMYRRAGPVNLNALRAISQAIGGARTGTPMTIPREIKSKITNLLKEYKIGEYAQSKEGSGKMNNDYEISESTYGAVGFAESKIDKESRLIPGVLLLKETSQNKYFPGSKGTLFTEKFRSDIVNMIEGKKFYLDHVDSSELKKHRGVRSVRDVAGYYTNGRLDNNGLPRADIKYLESHSALVESLVGEMADKVGLSIVASGPMRMNRDTAIAEAYECHSLASVDLVTEPGSTINMFESDHTDENEEDGEMDINDLTVAQLIESRPDLVKSITENVQNSLSTEKEVEGLKAKITELTESNKQLKTDLDEYKVKEEMAAKKARIDKMITESKIDKNLVTEVFRENLYEAKDDEAVKKLIEDRKALKKSSGVTGMGDEQEIEESGGDDITDEELNKRIVEAAGGRE